MQQYRPNQIGVVVRNLIIINVIVWFAEKMFDGGGLDLVKNFAMYNFTSENFRIWQPLTSMFMHSTSSFTHILFNMYALWLFGRPLENVWGSKRFLTYYLITGVGAALLYQAVQFIQMDAILLGSIETLKNNLSPEAFAAFIGKQQVTGSGIDISAFIDQWAKNPDSLAFKDQAMKLAYSVYELKNNIPCLGASGAVYGVLLAFGMLFPNTQLYFFFIPYPIKAKYLVMIYGGLELFLGLTQTNSNVAHFAHLGGMLFGYFLIKQWSKNRTHFY
ncbi:MAG: rhomboid family intramembrane serine protease [Bacteroidales bacterium]